MIKKRLLSFAIFALTVASLQATDRPPNIIFILVDDLGYGDLGAFFQNQRRAAGNRASIQTPHLDALAAGGARLTDHYSAAPVCAPSRASLLSGLHQGHANVRDNQFDKALADNHTLATVLRQARYATAAIGKWGLQGRAQGGAPHWPAHPLNRGFDSFYGYIRHIDGHEHYPKEAPYRNRRTTPPKKGGSADEADDANPNLLGKEVWEDRAEVSSGLDLCYTTDLFAARAKHWIGDHTASHPIQPFFLYLAFDTPHAVTELPPCPFPSGGGRTGGLQWLGTPGKMINTATGKVDSWYHPDYAEATFLDSMGRTQPWPDVYRRYATSVRRIDDAIGDLVQLLRDLELADNTLIVFSSDNGPSLESYLPEDLSPEFFASFGPFDGIKRDLWEGGTRVPTLAHWPARIPAGLVLSAPTAHWDWLPTFAAAANLPAPANADGVSLLPALSGKPAPALMQRPLYFEYAVNGKTPAYPAFEASRRNRPRGQMQAIRLGDLVGVRYDIKSASDDFELYNVRKDPKQAFNLAGDPAQDPTQSKLKALALQSRRADPSAPRPYDTVAIPAIASPATKTEAGLVWTRTDGAFPWIPAAVTLHSHAVGSSPSIDLKAIERPESEFVVTFTGYLEVPSEGSYSFVLAANTGALLRLHSATLIDCDHGYPAGTERASTVKLAAGLHPFTLSYRHTGSAPPSLTLDWSGPGFPRQNISQSAIRH
ncbi:MAG: sulfatase-like hydrolase/transferase [Opitutaceae bacterium]|nr:sulfatase-like hydrolase/transferase [Opitutaceae bacterium]